MARAKKGTVNQAGAKAGKDFLKEGFDLSRSEEKVLKFWEANRIFEKTLEKTKDGKPFTFYDGPPFATGLPHYGHILASTIKDVIPRYQTMRGRFVRRRWGWDCHGLPIEEIVERKLGISGKKQIEAMGIRKFNETCQSTVLQFAEEWGKMVSRIARWVDFTNSYKTMDATYMESVWWGFKKIFDKGLVYEGRKVLLYCPRCETPISNFEVAMDNSYKDVTEEAVTIKFRVKSSKFKNGEAVPPNTYILAWTTTPWTLPGNIALAVGEKMSYTVVRIAGANELCVLASELVDKVFKGKQIEVVHHDIPGKDLVGFEYEPLFDVPAMRSETSYKVYAADFVTTDEGTGIVHTAVVYGEDDYALGTRVGLPVVPLLDEKGKFNEKAPAFIRGMDFKESEKHIKRDLDERGLLLDRTMHQHSYPHCWRCGSTLFYNAIPAWFINIQKIKPQLLKSNTKEINWFPSHLKHGRYEKSVEQAPDWNISRNRYWGNPIPAWKCDACGTVEVFGSLDELDKRAGGAKNTYYVVRHGESLANTKGILDRSKKKFPLTTLGRDQALSAGKKLAKANIDVIIASDVERTAETAAIIASHIGIPKIIFDERLREIDLGSLTGGKDSEYHLLFPTLKERFVRHPEGGESVRDLRARIWAALQEYESTYRGKNILLVAHEYPIWMFHHIASGWSEERAIQEKEARGDDFVRFAEPVKLPFKVMPRNDSGEVDLHRPYIDELSFPCAKRDGVMRRTPEIFDSWVEAGSMPFAEYHYPFENKRVFESRLPAQFVAEYIAQTRAWFYVMHVISLVLFGRAPFENVVTTGTILAEDGSKMSKSKNNFPDPWKIIEKHGADNLRFYLMNSVVMQADNLNFSEKGVEEVHRKIATLLRNVYNYFRTYVPRQGPFPMPRDPRTANPLDLWIRVRTADLASRVGSYLDAYDTVRATREIQAYVDDLSTWYLRRSRKRSDDAFWNTLSTCLLDMSAVIAPVMPFLAEELYQDLKPFAVSREESVHLLEWPEPTPPLAGKARSALVDGMAEVRRLASLVFAKRAGAKIKVRQPLAMLKLKTKNQNFSVNPELLEILREEVNVKDISFDAKLSSDLELDTTITPELRTEGLLRELVRAVQELRQTASLKPSDRIVLLCAAANFGALVQENEAFVKKEVGADAIEYKKSAKFAAEAETKLDEEDVWLAIRKD